MAEIQDRHRKAAWDWQEGNGISHEKCAETLCAFCLADGRDRDIYAQALADVEDLNGYDLTACRAAYAHVCDAIVPGAGPGGAAAMATMVLLFKKERDDARYERMQNADKAAEALIALQGLVTAVEATSAAGRNPDEGAALDLASAVLSAESADAPAPEAADTIDVITVAEEGVVKKVTVQGREFLEDRPSENCAACRYYWWRKGACTKMPAGSDEDRRYWSEPSHRPRWCPGFERDPNGCEQCGRTTNTPIPPDTDCSRCRAGLGADQ